ncbi:MAG: hypothetical protein DHS20C18_47990 [Saprospiraceae bacterium]|nr:MAG: hypothetical protein DHS20C18_47990 [Saprospiraceae bacterium]
MKIFHVYLLALVFIFFLTAIRTPVEFDSGKGLVAYYSFNECDARDDSGNGSNGEMYGDISCWCGIDDDGLLLDGERDYLQFPGPVNRYFTTSDFTISFYFKVEGYLLFPQSLLSKREICDDYNMFDIHRDMQKQQVITNVYENPQKFYGGLNTGVDSKGWYHYALVREGFRARTYINGSLREESYRCSGVDISNEAVLSFSDSPCIRTGRASRFKGVLDELRVYDHALTEEEIASLYALYPVENVQMDCVTFAPKKSPDWLPITDETSYLCGSLTNPVIGSL